MKTSARGIALIREFEGFSEVAYADVVNVWTIGYGFTKGVKPGDKMTRQQADERLAEELREYEEGIEQACSAPLNQNQFDALACFTWNVGIGGMKKSSVVRAHNRGDTEAAARAFSLWNKAGGKVYPGLVRRRAAEAALYLEPVGEVQAMPQAVEAEKPMSASTINRASVIAGGTAAAASVSEVLNAVNSVKDGVEGLGPWLVPALLAAVVGLCGYIVWQRFGMRRSGQA